MKYIAFLAAVFSVLLQSHTAFANPALARAISSSVSSGSAGARVASRATASTRMFESLSRSGHASGLQNFQNVLSSSPELGVALAGRAYLEDDSVRDFFDEHGLGDQIKEFASIGNNSLSYQFVRACDGHGAAQSFLANSVAGIASRLKSHGRGNTPEDLAQSFWIKFASICKNFSVQSDRATYSMIKRILTNNATDSYRRADASNYLSNHISLPDEFRLHRDTILLPPSGASSAFNMKQVLGALSRLLSDKEKQALSLVVMGYSYEEAASLMEVKQSRVKDLVKDARRKAKSLSFLL